MMSAFIPFVSDGEVVAIGRGFCTRTLPKSLWTHAAHFATALWLLRCHPEIDITRAMPKMIREYNAATGGANTDAGGYHETITQASIRAARGFLRGRTHMPLFAVCNELMETQLGRSDWPLKYWSRERLFSVEARRAWVEPDLESFPY
jgi:hypothetical protein